MKKSSYELRREVDNLRSMKYRREHYRVFSISFRLDDDAKILEYLDTLPSKADYMRELIEKDLVSKGVLESESKEGN
jgi:hypothetical protein